MMVLGLDFAIHTGWAVIEKNKNEGLPEDLHSKKFPIVDSGVIVLSPNGCKDQSKRYLSFYNFLDTKLRELENIDLIVYEHVTFFTRGGKDGRRPSATWQQDYGAYRGITLVAAHNNCIPILPITPTELKSFVAGKGNANKEEMVRWIEGWGYKPQDHNEADAIGLALRGLHIYNDKN